MELYTTTKVEADGRVMASRTKALSLSVSVTLANVQQVGAQLEGEVDATIDFGFGSVNVVFPFSIDTGLGSPITVDLELGRFARHRCRGDGCRLQLRPRGASAFCGTDRGRHCGRDDGRQLLNARRIERWAARERGPPS